MTSMLNNERPLVFCPGCSHDRVVKSLDKALMNMDLAEHQVAIVSDIGCSGLFDTFFNTHAFHGLHGRALTYATGLKLARPDLHVIVTMGDGGLGIGGAHVLSTCRRNVDLTLLVMNNFNYGMTGGQCSSTTPSEANVSSGFLNRLEKPIDICSVAGAAGAPYVSRASAHGKGLVEAIEEALKFNGFSIVDIRGVCTGRYTKRNRINPAMIEEEMAAMPNLEQFREINKRPDYGTIYREEAARQPEPKKPAKVAPRFKPLAPGRSEVVILGGAGQRIVTAGELLCLAGMTAGLHASQKNDYPITVLRGHSVSELILADDEIGFTGITNPAVVMALAPEGVGKRTRMLKNLPEDTLVIKASDVALPEMKNETIELDFKSLKIKSTDRALATLAVMAGRNRIISPDMLKAALDFRFKGDVLEESLNLVNKVTEL